MLNKGILEIIQLNNDFYEKNAKSFDRSREFYWKGFENTLKYIKNGQKILDLGCGNARFYKFLKENNLKINYTGLDSNTMFIQENKEKHPEAKFEKEDIVNNLLSINEKFNFIAVFGVTHHLPGRKFRKIWFHNLKRIVEEGGVIVLSFWQFNKEKNDINFKTKEYLIEKGDYFLGWKGDYSSHRYCHDFSDDELEEIKQIFNDFELMEEFQKEDNKYLLFQKK